MISTFDEVREILSSPNANLEKKIYRYLNPRMVRFIEHSPLHLFQPSIQKVFNHFTQG